jgi:site-specific recombinase XerD
MVNQSTTNALVPVQGTYQIALRVAISLWAGATTSDGKRRMDLLRDKQRIVLSFFDYVDKHPADVTPIDVQAWLLALERRGFKPGTVYNHACLLSSFYSWTMRDPDLGSQIRSNPARLARPKAPKLYQSESAKSLSDEEIKSLVRVIRERALSGNLVGKRDYALLLFYLATGLRRTEVISLRGIEIHINKTLIINYRAKGGDYRAREVAEPQVKEALCDYLSTAGRLYILGTNEPVWTRHDHAGKTGAPLTSHCFVKNMKQYAREAGVKNFHLYRTRHTYARIVSEFTGDITATQNALDHQNRSTTRVYVQRIAVKRDPYSREISRRWYM